MKWKCPGCGSPTSGRARVRLCSCSTAGSVSTPVCSECGTRDDVKAVPVPFIEKSRGTQLSITGMQVVYRCWACDRRLAEATQHRHIPPGQHPAK